MKFGRGAGSTTYKLRKKNPVQAQVKIFRHNQAATERINAHSGNVIKYLGDGVMAIFKGKGVEPKINAIKTAIEIQKTFLE